MLQWMGGSRRKITTSRKSTQKRQQQFFEQRKRQQHQHEVTYVESHNDSPVAYAHQKGNRSLDILSIINVPKVAAEGKSACGIEHNSMMTNRPPRSKYSQAVDIEDHQSSMRSSIAVTGEVTAAADYVEPTGKRTLTSHQAERVSSNCTWNNASTIRNAETKNWGIDSCIQTSILDIIGVDEPINSSKGKPAYEAHVAFSVEGLGDLGTETPKQSPQQPVRSCVDTSSFNNAAKKFHFRENLNSMLNDLETEKECFVQDTKETICGNHLDTFLASEDVLTPLGYTEHKLSPVNSGKKLGTKRWEMDSFHGDKDTTFWNASSSFLDDNIVNEKCGSDWTNDVANILRHVSPGFGSKVPQPRFEDDLTTRYVDLDEGDCHFSSLEKPNKYSSLLSDYRPQATRLFPYMDMGDRRDNLNSLSEESCSSTAVRLKIVRRLKLNAEVLDECQSNYMQ